MDRPLKSTFLFFAVMVGFALPISGQAGSVGPFLTQLRVGSVGDEVLALQKALNADPDTRIAASGPGSPGEESRYFGTLTKKAVIRFQEKYAAQILAPNGLSKGTGLVGLSTRNMLNVLQGAAGGTTTSSPTAGKSSPVPITPTMQVAPGVNPNSINLDFVIEKLRSDGAKRGISDAAISEEIDAIKEIAATTTDLHKEFFDRFNVRPKTTNTIPSLSLLDQADPASRSFFLKILAVVGLGETAHAQSAGLPFGGLIVFMFPCTCSFPTWHIFIEPPLPPTYAEELDAVEGDQLFLSYNIPMVGTYLLGYYVPGVPTCFMYVGTHCHPFEPTWGLVSPFVGSSPL